jgi:hypothetical protein
MNSKKYFKLLYGTTSYGSGQPYEYEINKIQQHLNFDENPKHNYGGFFIAEKYLILRFLTWGTTLYEVNVPPDAKIVQVPGEILKDGIYKTDKMELCNPIQLNDELVLQLIKETNVPEATWFDIISLCALQGFKKSALKIIKLYVTEKNIDEAIKRYTKYYNYRFGFMFGNVQADIECAETIYQLLCKKQNNVYNNQPLVVI